jgi:hypothetical protein
MRLAIRDDDTCYFTRPEELDRVYSHFPGIPVSLAVTPFALKCENLGDPARFRQAAPPMPLGENGELVRYLAARIAEGRNSVLCHGHTHEYLHRRAHWIPECVWKSPLRLGTEAAQGRQYLEKLLDCRVDAYVPPGNAISRPGIAAVGETFPYILGTLPLRRAREFAIDGPARAAWRLRMADQLRLGGPRPSPYRIGGVRMLACSSWTAIADWESICARMDLCHRLEGDFAIAVHYWELRGRVFDGLRRLVDRALALGFHPDHCGQLFVSPEAAAGAATQGRKDCAWADSKIS